MKTKKHDTRWMVSCCTYGSDRHRPREHTAWHDPASSHQGDNSTHSCHHRSNPFGAFCGRRFGSRIRHLLRHQQHHGTYTFILCVFTFYEHDRISRSCQSAVDLNRMPYPDRRRRRLALAPVLHFHWNQTICLPIVGFAGSMVNTITVMGSIYLFFAREYAQAQDVGLTAVWGLIMGTITASGIPEAIASAVLVLALGKVLLKFMKRSLI